jgi:flagellin-like hook-associated protein FlgL
VRITESRIMQLASSAVSDARTRAAKAGEAVQTGRRVERPSDDPAAWATGARAAARKVLSGERGQAMAHLMDGLAQTDDALGAIGESLTRAAEIGIQALNGTLSAADRAAPVAGGEEALGEVQGAVGQVANVRAEAGARRAVLLSADEARGAFEQRLDETIARAVEADPIAAVSELARSSAGLEAARAAANQLISLFQGVR